MAAYLCAPVRSRALLLRPWSLLRRSPLCYPLAGCASPAGVTRFPRPALSLWYKSAGKRKLLTLDVSWSGIFSESSTIRPPQMPEATLCAFSQDLMFWGQICTGIRSPGLMGSRSPYHLVGGHSGTCCSIYMGKDTPPVDGKVPPTGDVIISWTRWIGLCISSLCCKVFWQVFHSAMKWYQPVREPRGIWSDADLKPAEESTLMAAVWWKWQPGAGTVRMRWCFGINRC